MASGSKGPAQMSGVGLADYRDAGNKNHRGTNYQSYFHIFNSPWGEAETVNGGSTTELRVCGMRETG